jgi:hypothetical protein
VLACAHGDQGGDLRPLNEHLITCGVQLEAFARDNHAIAPVRNRPATPAAAVPA